MVLIKFAFVFLIAFLSAGYGVDRDYQLPYKKNGYMIRLKKKSKFIFMFKHQDRRSTFVLAGVVLECVAYAMFALDLLLAMVLKEAEQIKLGVRFNWWVMGVVFVLGTISWLYYIYYKKRYWSKSRK